MRSSFFLLSKDPFAVLGLARTATKAEVKMRYRELARLHHPDSGTGDSEKMERINKAYNFLLKEGAYEQLRSKLVGQKPKAETRWPSPISTEQLQQSEDHVSATLSEEECAKLSALDPSTERVTPTGKYMYQNRDDGKWVELDRPLVRAQQPRYASFSAKSEMTEELRRRSLDLEKEDNAKTVFQRGVDRLSDSGDLPSRSPTFLRLYLVLALVSIYFMYQRAFAWGKHHRNRTWFYESLEEKREELMETYMRHRKVVETSVAAAAIVLIAASEGKVESDPVVPVKPGRHFRTVQPPKDHFSIVAGG
ncbi:chaperone protein DNAj, putative [Trypanosoma brucei gambiense DAL972]|uniref:Chaperone protein DNAj, putative n=2 Tax=Trypanosoma brucei TaxID=5691 RepID=C9ZR42_TRYB9|nr:chaperone protein DNAj, putative [Trypanosoma brucei gambiense DAL972]RHW72000.1 chaperone protein DNAj [Trypanosoma brucei equiperdum]CBH11872.1 chaperone protein DNAj, putative [Trypanosoma brucei gambiense DAL972]|eukprot:XP_011774157.1 chaperone protein DNAj, putative [Trypanosoma brucei gambiense DAL972]